MPCLYLDRYPKTAGGAFVKTAFSAFERFDSALLEWMRRPCHLFVKRCLQLARMCPVEPRFSGSPVLFSALGGNHEVHVGRGAGGRHFVFTNPIYIFWAPSLLNAHCGRFSPKGYWLRQSQSSQLRPVEWESPRSFEPQGPYLDGKSLHMPDCSAPDRPALRLGARLEAHKFFWFIEVLTQSFAKLHPSSSGSRLNRTQTQVQRFCCLFQ